MRWENDRRSYGAELGGVESDATFDPLLPLLGVPTAESRLHGGECTCHDGIEVRAGVLLDVLERALRQPSRAVRPLRHQRVVDIDDGHEPREHGDRLTSQTAGIPLAIEA